MASSYTDLGSELMTTGENAGTWGSKTNTNIQILEEAVRGYVAVGVASADATLSLTDGSTGDSTRNMVIAFTGALAGNRTITVPAVEKMWIMDNQTTEAYTLTVKASGQTGVTWATTDKGTKILYANGTDVIDTGIADNAVTSGTGDITLDSAADIVIDAAGGNIEFKDAGTTQLLLDMDTTSGVQIIQLKVNSDDLVFQQYDGNEVVRIADDRRLYFYDKGGEYIYGDGTDLNITSGADINIPSAIGLTFGDDGEKIEGDGTDLTISGNIINLTATADVVIPNAVGIQFGGASEKIEGDGTDLTISANNLTVDAAADIILDAAGNNLTFKSGGTAILDISNSSSDAVIQQQVNGYDIIFKQYDGNTLLTIDDAGFVGIHNAAAGPGQLRFYEDTDNGTNYTAFQVGTQSGDVTYTLPTADGTSGYQLTTDGPGTLSWASSAAALAADDISAGDAAVTLSTSSGNITIDATANNTDIIFKGTDATADITMLTLDGSEAGAATFNNKIVATELDISGDVDIDGTLEADAITIGSTAIGSIYGVVAGSSSIVTTGALDSGSITSGFGAIDNGTSGIRTDTFTAETSLVPDASGGADIGTASLEWGDVYVADDKYIQFGSDQNILVGYDETTTDSFKIAATEGAGLAITLMADEGDDAGDEWKLNVADGGVITLGNDINSAGTYVTHLTLTPNSTVTSSLATFAGEVQMVTLDIGGTNVTSTAAELNYSDLATLGTSAASKVLSADSDNLTKITGGVYLEEDTLSFDATQDWDVRASPVAKVTLTANVEFDAPSNPTTGQYISILCIQDAGGSNTIAWNGVFEFASDTAPTATTTGDLGDLFTFRYNGAKWLEVGRNLALTLS